MSGLAASVSAAGAAWRCAGAATMRRAVATSAPLERRFPRAKLRLNTDLLPRSEQINVAVSDKPDPSRGVPQPDGGIQYYGFTYYPRFAEQPDPVVTPAKLHRLQLTYPMRGQPYWVKNTCKLLGLHDPNNGTNTRGAVSVVKNIPSVNAVLYKVKHVLKIDPITFPDGEPNTDDLDGWQLLEDGRVVRNAHYNIGPVATEYDRLKISGNTMKERLRLRWIKPFDLDEKRTV